jgi:transposase
MYTPIIPRRKNKINKSSLNKNEINIYRKRIVVENFFAWLKRYPKIDRIYEKTNLSYKGLLLMASSIIIFNRI